ncbi:MAG TPA: PA domain-containing protein [Telluria sp.]|nr:PA domain-containing protein [Telluria sp.]
MKQNKNFRLAGLAGAALLACAAVGNAQAAATIVINNINAAGIGFNDTTPATPVGGNSGTTLGQQRLIAFTYAANIWGATLTSSQPIIINAQFSALSCTATSATLGSAGATSIFRNFANAPRADTWYSYALANKLSGTYLGTANAPQINANFNVNLGQPGCLTNSFFYLGLDANHGSNVDFVATLLHEMGHGVGFQTFTSGTTGNYNGGFPSVWDHYLLDNTTNKTWVQMTAAERAASAIKPAGLSWTGPNVTAAVPNVLSRPGEVKVYGSNAGAAAGTYQYGDASFGPPLRSPAVVGNVMPVVDQADGSGLACDALSAANTTAVRGSIALVSRGVCGFAIKAKNVQNAGAIGMIVADNAPGDAAGMSGTDDTITIPSVRITQAAGVTLKAALGKRTRTVSGVTASLGVTTTGFAGTDAQNRITMYTPNPFVSGSSVSHYNTTATPNQLMEPSINGDLTHSPTLPRDLTFELLKDIGW